MKQHFGPQKFTKLFETASKASFKKYGFVNEKIVTNWPYIVGKEIANICFPEKIVFTPNQTRCGTLYVIINNPAMSLIIQAQESRILEKISTYFGYKAVARLKINIDKTGAFKKPLETTVNHRQKITPNQMQDIVTQLSKISDSQLRKQLESMKDSFFEI